MKKKDLKYFEEFLNDRLRELLSQADHTVSGMTEQKENQMKLCRMCNTVKGLEGGFYKAGSSYKRNCIP